MPSLCSRSLYFLLRVLSHLPAPSIVSSTQLLLNGLDSNPLLNCEPRGQLLSLACLLLYQNTLCSMTVDPSGVDPRRDGGNRRPQFQSELCHLELLDLEGHI